jgi:dimethylargininase
MLALSRVGAWRITGESPKVVIVKPFASPYVASDAGSLAGAVVLRPATAVDRLPPLKAEPSPIAERAQEQHRILVRTLTDNGVAVTAMEPKSESATESLVADCALVLPQGAILTRPSQIERRTEVARVEEQLTALGIPIVGRIEAPGLLDATDVAIGPDRIFIGVPRGGVGLRPHSNAMGRKQLETLAAGMGYRIVELPLAPEALRLRNVFNVVGAETVVASPDKVDLVALTGMKLVEVPRGEEYAAGVLPLGERRVVANLRFRESIALMRKAKVAVEAIDLWEFGKAGYGPFSLVLAVKRG